MVPMARAAPSPATAPASALRGPLRRIASVAARSQSGLIALTTNERGGRSLCRPRILDGLAYFRLVIAVRSAESLTMPVALHQLEPKPPGLIGVTKDGLKLVVVKSLVKTLQFAFERLVSE